MAASARCEIVDGRCLACGQQRTPGVRYLCPEKSTPPERLRSIAQAMACVHFSGVLVRTESAVCCGGKKTRHKVFACAIHEECQLGSVLPGIAWCRKCAEWRGRR